MAESPRRRPGSVVMVEINGRKYPMKTVARCLTCMSPHRQQIELAILEQHSYQRIADSLIGLETGARSHPTATAIREHVIRGHMPIGPAAERALVEERAKQLGRNIEDAATNLADYASVNQIIIQRGMGRLARGELKPSMAELLTAIRMQHAIDSSTEDGLDSQAWQEALVVYMEVAQRFIPPELFQSYGQALAQHPVLRALMTGRSQRALETASGEG